MCPRRQPPKPTPEFLSRRDWIRIFALGTATHLGGLVKPQTVVAALGPSVNNSCVLPVRLSSFTGLQSPGSSIRIFFSTLFNPFIVTHDVVENPPGVFTDVFYAFDSTCTHENTAVAAYNAGDGLMTCPNHGSTYDIQGNVVNGPALANLKRLPVAYDGNDLVEVELNSSFNPNFANNAVATTALPSIPLKIASVTVQSQTASVTRLRLTFPVVRRANYRIKYYADFTSAPTVVPYFATSTSTTPISAVINYNPISGSASMPANANYYTSSFNAWVEAPNSATRGFFAVEMIYPL